MNCHLFPVERAEAEAFGSISLRNNMVNDTKKAANDNRINRRVTRISAIYSLPE
jgi:hypothetical protein